MEVFEIISSTIVSSIILLISYYYFIVVKKPKLLVNNKTLSNFLQNHVTILNEYYWPSFFYWEGRLQTILGIRKRLPNSVKLPYRREIFKLKDGGELGLDFLENETMNNNDGNFGNNFVVFLLPGLTSSSQTSYIKTLVLALGRAGASVVIMNYRGLGGIPLKTPKTHNICDCEDIHEVVMYLKKAYANKRFMAVGTSLGGILLCRYLITQPEEARNTFEVAFVISTVWDVWAATESLERPIINKYVINYGLCQDVVYRVKKCQNILEQRKDCWDFEHIYASKLGRDFDTRFHVPQAGYASLKEYYDNCLIVNHTHKFPIQVIAVNADDDPMQPCKSLPVKEIYTTNPKSNLALIVTSGGGHLGFLEGFLTKPKPIHFIERLTEQVVRAVRTHGHELKKNS